MTIIKVPRAPMSSMSKRRDISTLLKNQILHLQEAEFRLPAKYQTNIYIHSITKEYQAGEYIRQVTQAIHDARGTDLAQRRRRPERVFEMAASEEVPRKKKTAKKKASRKKATPANQKKHAKAKSRK